VDIVATVNGVEADGVGNSLSINTSVLDLTLTVDAGSSTNFSFDITGGGALFQLGPDVTTNQQARLGIGSVSTGQLGGANGRLYELGSGQARSLENDVAGASVMLSFKRKSEPELYVAPVPLVLIHPARKAPLFLYRRIVSEACVPSWCI